MWEPHGKHRVQIRYGGTVSVPPGTTLYNMAQCAGLKTPTIVSIAPTTDTQPPHPALPNNQHQPPPLVPPKVWGDSDENYSIEPCRKVSTQPARKVGDLARIFEKTQDVKTTPLPGRRPATKKTTLKTARTKEDDGGTKQCVPKIVERSFKNNSEKLDQSSVVFRDFGRQPPVDFDLLTSSDLHEPLPDDVTAVQTSCTTNTKENVPKARRESKNLTLRLHLQPFQPTQEQLQDVISIFSVPPTTVEKEHSATTPHCVPPMVVRDL